jgi:hypothetical protein
MTQPMPLTDFLIAMLKTPPDKLARADPVKLAAKYEIDVAHATAYLHLHRG